MDSDKDKRQQELAHLMLHKARQDYDAAQNFGNSRAIAQARFIQWALDIIDLDSRKGTSAQISRRE